MGAKWSCLNPHVSVAMPRRTVKYNLKYGDKLLLMLRFTQGEAKQEPDVSCCFLFFRMQCIAQPCYSSYSKLRWKDMFRAGILNLTPYIFWSNKLEVLDYTSKHCSWANLCCFNGIICSTCHAVSEKSRIKLVKVLSVLYILQQQLEEQFVQIPWLSDKMSACGASLRFVALTMLKGASSVSYKKAVYVGRP